jgi:hypothetical protein
MKIHILKMAILSLLLNMTTSCGRSIRTAIDVTPGNACEKLDWRYGAADIRIQTSKINRQLMDRWFFKTGYQGEIGKPRMIITQIDNCTDQYIPSDLIRDIIESTAINDGRYTIVVGNETDEQELNYLMDKVQCDPKYNNPSRLLTGQATAPQFLAKIRITKAVTSDRFYDYEDYRMTITLYDIETQAAIDSAWDVLRKRVRR